MENSSLTQFGTSFQSKIIVSCLIDTMFLQTIMEVLQPEHFESDANSWLVKEINKYFLKYKTTPTLEAIKIAVVDVENDVLKLTIVEALKESWRYREANDLPFVQEKTLEFCKNQVLKSAILESANLLESQNYDGIKTVIDNAMKAGTSVDIGHDYNVGIEERLTKSTRITIKTPWDIINEIDLHMMYRFKDIEDASLGLATRIIERLNFAINTEGSASMVLTGGKSIQRTLQLLSDEELSWEKVTVILSDERYLVISD